MNHAACMDPLDLSHSFIFDNDNDEENDEDLLAIIAVIALGQEHAKQQHINCRNAHRLYLTRPQLIKNPRVGTPWHILCTSRSDCTYITTMGMDCETFDKILEGGFSLVWNTTSIPRYNVEKLAVPCIHRVLSMPLERLDMYFII